jgi:hypothetical protein
MNFGSKWLFIAVIVLGWLGSSQSVNALERVAPRVQLISDAEPGSRSRSDYSSRHSFGTDRTGRLRRGRVVENVVVFIAGAASAVAGVALGGLTFAIAAGAAGVYIVLALP